MIDGVPIIDGIVHAYNSLPDNFANAHGAMIVDEVSDFVSAANPPGYSIPKEAFQRDWTAEEVAHVTFTESYTDLAVSHVLPIRAFKDGWVSVEKNRELQDRWPERFFVYAGVDPMEGGKALDDLERQVELFDNPIGVKLYPNSWVGSEINGWYMDDPEIAFPVFERAQQLGLKVVAVHKAVPLGVVPRSNYTVSDVERAAIAFPHLQFEIVHGGMAFLEETAWELAKFENVWVNLEATTSLLTYRPAAFEQALAALLMRPASIDRIIWGTGAVAWHPRPIIEKFVRDFSFRAEIVDGFGVPQLDMAAKRKILAENYARLLGIDLAERLERVADDEFAVRRQEGLRPPYSSTGVGDQVA